MHGKLLDERMANCGFSFTFSSKVIDFAFASSGIVVPHISTDKSFYSSSFPFIC